MINSSASPSTSALGVTSPSPSSLRIDDAAFRKFIEPVLLDIESTPLGSPKLPGLYKDLADYCLKRYRKSCEIPYLELCIKFNKAAVEGTTHVDSHFVKRQENLAESLVERYRDFGSLADLDRAKAVLYAAVRRTLLGHTTLPQLLQDLGAIYGDRLQRFGLLVDLDMSMRFDRAAVDACVPDHPTLPSIQQGLAASYTDRYRLLGDVHDLEMAMHYDQAAVSRIPADHPNFSLMQLNVAVSYTERYRRLGDIDDLEMAIQHNLKALESMPSGHAHLPRLHKNLAMCYRDKFRRLGSLDDLNTALKYDRAAVDGTPPENPELPGRQLELAASYMDRYRRLGGLEDLEAALQYNLASVEGTPPGHPHLAGRQHDLASAYLEQHRRLGNLDDLKWGVHYNEAAVAGTPLDHPELSRRQNNLAISYKNYYLKTSDLNSLDLALRYDYAAVTGTPAGHLDLPRRKQSLAITYRMKFQRFGELDDLKWALHFAQEAVIDTDSDNAELPGRQEVLASCYYEKYKKRGELDDLKVAVSFYQEAVKNTASDHFLLSDRLQGLAHIYFDLCRRTQDLGDFKTGVTILKTAAQSPSSSPSSVWSIAIYLSKQPLLQIIPDIIDIYTAAFAVLPDLLWIGNSLHTRHDMIVEREISGVTSAAAAVALELGDVAKAVEFLDAGFAITHRQSSQLAEQNAQLWNAFPQEAQALQDISILLQRVADGQAPSHVNPHMLVLERKNLITEIRRKHQFEDFLCPPTWSMLSEAAAEGPVIILTCTSSKAEAVLVLHPPENSHTIGLPEVAQAKLKEIAQQFKFGLHQCSIPTRSISRYGRKAVDQTDPHTILQNVIQWLWKAVVKPVFVALAKYGISDGRIWWCPSGPFTYLPIHAAAPVETRFVHSYTFTLESLIRSRAKHSQSTPQVKESITVVGVTHLPRLPAFAPLPSVRKEIQDISAQFSSSIHSFTKLMDSDATMERVLTQLESSAWVHFACHGQQDASDPLNSGLELYDQRLRLADLRRTNASVAKFVFLSACETATGDERLINEAMHLAGGFIAHGFLGAIGTLWSMPDAYGPRVASLVYGRVFGSGGLPELTAAAEGLCTAVQQLRKEGAPMHQWMPFIHVGI